LELGDGSAARARLSRPGFFLQLLLDGGRGVAAYACGEWGMAQFTRFTPRAAAHAWEGEGRDSSCRGGAGAGGLRGGERARAKVVLTARGRGLRLARAKRPETPNGISDFSHFCWHHINVNMNSQIENMVNENVFI